MKVLSVLLLVAILLGGCAPTAKNIKADEEYQMTFVDKMKILGGLFVAYLQDTDYEPREQRRYIIYDRWNNYLREKRERSFDPFDTLPGTGRTGGAWIKKMTPSLP
jgi:hypothetical protein